jgi:transcriptional regulator with XRE-family HTH domain
MLQQPYNTHTGNAPAPSSGSFAERIKLLIQRVGSATEIARMCGFSEGVVRSWRDGNSDPSRARCVTLAKTLGISLVWLVAGEGVIQPDAMARAGEDQSTTEQLARQQRTRSSSSSSWHGENSVAVDTQRLNTAMRILQSELELSQSKLTLDQNADMLANLYAILGPGGTHVDTSAMLTFNRRLSERLRQGKDLA